MKKFILLLFTCYALTASAQQPLATDYLGASFHKGRREALRQLMPANSVAVFFSSPERNFANDVEYKYHPNPDLYYFTGYTEPEAVLLIFKEPQTAGATVPYTEIFFVQERDSSRERWTGKRLGINGVKSKLGFDQVYNGSEFARFPIDLALFDKVIFESIIDLYDNPRATADVYDLYHAFIKKAGIPESYNEEFRASLNKLPRIVRNAKDSKVQKLIAYEKVLGEQNPRFKEDPLFVELMAVQDSAGLMAIYEKIKNSKWDTEQFSQLTGALRQIKTPEEMDLLRKAIDISCLAHTEAMKAVRPNMSELELQGIQEFIHKKLGAEDVGYPSIVGAGQNGCILHYIENSVSQVGKETVLMDIGAQYHGYSADITRTIPANGKFSKEQKAVYDLVYEAQEAVFAICKEGTSFRQIEDTATAILTRGLIKLGILKKAEDIRIFYPHGCSHYLGLDVHDKGDYIAVKENMVITVEPGIYIPDNSPCDKKWWGIAVRIEDDVRIGKEKFELLSTLAPRKSEDVEKMVAEKSFVDGIVLPEPGRKKAF
ncbi:aminopeptidase P family protein [Flavihumibacter profundi]|uniref:aminopeptidase P family protein n=1 Tax=Flavihumibacter profundi TaxID=2716883 RepID=UPI001CC63F74|nr:aminopeptidase P N-terminal domain-containing protein [Flavihumibacter profundi]MBZ5855643.1 aminopeptidase P N-terminal domain-containing protein [Flavihumibacter profundi]